MEAIYKYANLIVSNTGIGLEIIDEKTNRKVGEIGKGAFAQQYGGNFERLLTHLANQTRRPENETGKESRAVQ